jgi:ketosteroid isomerase-like protein
MMSSGRFEEVATAEQLPRFFAPDVQLHQMVAMSGTAGEFAGHAGVVESAREIVREFVDPAFMPERIGAAGERVAVAVGFHATGRRSGTPVQARVGHLFTLRDGLVTRLQVFEDPARAFAAAGLDESFAAGDS